jgi:xanthosine utilization system XapX-like protein
MMLSLRDAPVFLRAVFVLALLVVWLVPIFFGIRIAKRKGRSPHWMWFGVHPLGGWIALLVLYLVSPKSHLRKVNTKAYALYHHPKKGYEVVKQGFSWPGFWFTWVWAFVKRLPSTGVALLVGLLLLRILVDAEQPAFAALGLVGILAMSVGVGFHGNEWREISLRGRGYQLVETIRAENLTAAINIVSQHQLAEHKCDRALEGSRAA